MNSRYVGLALAMLVAVGGALSLPSCGHDQKLVSLQIQPLSHTFIEATAGQQEQLTASATYIHPPATKDVTSQATWSVDDGVVAVSAGVVTTVGGGACGGADITATVPEGTGGSSNIVSAYATITVDDPTNPLCPGGGTLATLSVAVQGNGIVRSATGPIDCPGVCVGTYDVGSSVLLTASPTPTWLGCTSFSNNSCTVTVPAGGAAVIATF